MSPVRLARVGVVVALVFGLAVSAVGAEKKPAPKKPAPKKPAEPAKPVEPQWAAESTIKLPAPVDGSAVGGSGKYLILHLRKLQQLAVIDVGEGKVLKYLPMPSGDLAITAGAEKLFVGIKDLKQIQRWDLAKLEREVTVPAPEGGIGSIAMGASAMAPLLVAEGMEKKFWQIDPKTMRADPVPSKHWAGQGGGAWGPEHVRVSFDGQTSIANGGGWAGIELGAIAGGRVTDVRSGGYVNGEALVAGNGQLVFRGPDEILRGDLESKVTGIKGTAFPAHDPAFSVAWHDDRRRDDTPPTLTVFGNADPRPLVMLRGLTELAKESQLPPWERVHLFPRLKKLITIGDGGDQLLIRRYDLEEELTKSGIDFLFVESTPPSAAVRGKAYAYDIAVKSKKGGVKLELQASPPGMTLSADGKIAWTPAATFGDPTATVIVQVSDSSGQTVFHSFVIRMGGAAVVASAVPPRGAPAATPAKPERTRPATGVKPPKPVQGVDPDGSAGAQLVTLEEPFAEYHAANAGRLLVFYQPRARQLAVYDTASGKVLGTIKLGVDNVRFACGRDMVVVALPDQRIFQTYSLKTRERVKSAPFPSASPFKDVRMGNDSAGPVYAHFGADLAAIDLATLAPIKLRGKPVPAGEKIDYRVSADGQTVVIWDPHIGPTPFTIARVRNGAVTPVVSTEGFSMGNRRFTPTADGSLVLYETTVYTAGAKPLNTTLKGYENFVPTSDPRFLIAVNETEGKRSDLAICTAVDRRVLAELKAVSNVGGTDGYDRGRCGIVHDMPGAGEPRVVYRPDAKLIALIPVTNDRIELITVGLGAAGAAPGALAVVSLPPSEIGVGETLSYQVQVVPEGAKVQYKVDAGPPGLTVSPAGLVKWKVAQRPVGGTASVILSVRDAGGQDVPHAFEVTVTRQATGAGGATAAPAPAIVKADERRIELPAGEARFAYGLGGRGLILAGEHLAVVGPDGLAIKESRVLPKAYVAIVERPTYYLAIAKEPRSIDWLDKRTLAVTRSRPIAFEALIDLVPHPTRAISYVSYVQPGGLPRHRFMIVDEQTAEARTDDNWIGRWLAVSPEGGFLLAGIQETYRKGSDIIDNPDRIWIVPTYGSIDMLARYDLDAAGFPERVAHKDGVGGGGVGLRISADGKRAAYLSATGFPAGSGNVGGWDPTDLRKLPVAYLTKGAATSRDLAFHPLLPLVAAPADGSVVFFNRETGAREPDRVEGADALVGAKVERAYFSPDGRNVLLQTTVGEVRYLHALPLKLSAEEAKAMGGSLPRPDKAVETKKAPAPPATPKKLPAVQA
ncbi:MAG TPA: putative Ig domain-containing protein [Tepidisphaeraceae bacterium]|nr:putative Ig domain-containing protein [Tepidisphaeraceae bacterium]